MTNISYSYTNTIELELNIGFSQYADLIREESIKEGFNMNLLFLGRRGLGMKTLINSLFNKKIIPNERKNELLKNFISIKENQITLNLIITTCNDFSIEKLKEFFENENKEFLETNLISLKKKDSRIHCCIFLLPLDEITIEEINCLKFLSNQCNLIPIMSKSDCYTKDELKKKRLFYQNLFKIHKIKTFLPPVFSHSDEFVFKQKEEIESKTPLAIISSEEFIEKDDQFLRVREYNWGSIYISSELNCDFNLLRKILISQNSMDLIYLTDIYFFNKFRFLYNKNKREIDIKSINQRIKELRIQIEDNINKKKISNNINIDKEKKEGVKNNINSNNNIIGEDNSNTLKKKEKK